MNAFWWWCVNVVIYEYSYDSHIMCKYELHMKCVVALTLCDDSNVNIKYSIDINIQLDMPYALHLFLFSFIYFLHHWCFVMNIQMNYISASISNIYLNFHSSILRKWHICILHRYSIHCAWLNIRSDAVFRYYTNLTWNGTIERWRKDDFAIKTDCFFVFVCVFCSNAFHIQTKQF